MKALVFFLAAYGAALALTVLDFGIPYRWLGEKIGEPAKTFVYCPACTGFWLALAGAFFWYSPAGEGPLDAIASALAASGLIWIVHVVLSKLGQNDL